MSTPSVAVVYLAWAPLGDGVVRRFVDSYRAHSAGLDHTLVVLLNGFEPGSGALDGVRAAFEDVAHETLSLDQPVRDLAAYRAAAEQLAPERCCFLNSYSTILADDWLAKIDGALTPGVGIAGATGSWNSARSSALYLLRIPGAYRDVFPDRAWHLAQSRRLPDDGSTRSGGPMSRPPLRYLRTSYLLSRSLALFPAFPASHVRTNAFVIRTETMKQLRFPPLRNKLQAWQLESGRGSITEQIVSGGLEAVVVGCDGRCYRPSEWADSDTLWQADQGELLVADNQTERYRLGDLDLRTLLSKVAWGSKARPSPPS
jgi:hypothetical protein